MDIFSIFKKKIELEKITLQDVLELSPNELYDAAIQYNPRKADEIRKKYGHGNKIPLSSSEKYTLITDYIEPFMRKKKINVH